MICDETGNGKPTQRHEVTRSCGVRAQNRSSPDTAGAGRGRTGGTRAQSRSSPGPPGEQELFCNQVFSDYDPSSSTSLLSSVGITTRP